MRKKILGLSILLLSLLNIIGCKNENNENSLELQNNTYNIDSLNKSKENANKVFYTLPTPMEMAKVFKNSGIKYDKTVLHQTSKSSNYYTNTSMALNLGIYGADLSFSSMFEQEQATLEYFKTIKVLATKMDIIGIVNDSLVEEIENNISDTEKLKKIVSQTFFASDAFLKENNREEVASIVATGAWIESLYIAILMSHKATSNKDELITRIIDQRLALENLIKLLECYNTNADVAILLTDIYALNEIFNSLVKIEKVEVYDKYSKTMRTKTVTTQNVTPKLLADLQTKVTLIRTSYTN